MGDHQKGRLAASKRARERDTEAFHLILVARDIVDTPGAWTRKRLARDKHSHPVSPTSERAVRFCLSGALLRAASEEFGFSIQVVASGEPESFQAPQSLMSAYREVALSFPGIGGLIEERELEEGQLSEPILAIPSVKVVQGENELTWRHLVEAVRRAGGHLHERSAAALELSTTRPTPARSARGSRSGPPGRGGPGGSP